jgi:hypothetical protein
MKSTKLEDELESISELIVEMKDHEDQKKEPTLKELALFLESNPDWGEDHTAKKFAKNLRKVLSAFLCQRA